MVLGVLRNVKYVLVNVKRNSMIIIGARPVDLPPNCFFESQNDGEKVDSEGKLYGKRSVPLEKVGATVGVPGMWV